MEEWKCNARIQLPSTVSWLGEGGSIISSFMLVWFKLPRIASAVVFPTDLEKLYLFMHANLNSLACAKTPIKR